MERGMRLPRLFLAGLILAGLVSSGAQAGTRKVECARLLIQSGSREVVIELPVPVLEALQARVPSELAVGTVAGSPLQVTCGGLLAAVHDKKAKGDEGVRVLSLESGPGPVSLTVRRVERKVSEEEGSASDLVYTTREKDAKVSAKVTVALDAIDQFAGNFSGGGADPDVGPFIRACLSVARDVGRGPLLWIEEGDVEKGFYLE